MAYTGKRTFISMLKSLGRSTPTTHGSNPRGAPLYCKQRGWIDGRIDLEATPNDLKPGNEILAVRYGMSVPLLEQQFVIDTAFEGACGMATLQHHILEGRVRYDHSEKEFYYWNGHAYTKDRTRLMSDAVLYTQAQYRHYVKLLSTEAEQANKEVSLAEKMVIDATSDDEKNVATVALNDVKSVVARLIKQVKELWDPIHRLNERRCAEYTSRLTHKT